MNTNICIAVIIIIITVIIGLIIINVCAKGDEVTPVGVTHTLHTPLNKFNLHVRGGHVIPWQTPALTTYER